MGTIRFLALGAGQDVGRSCVVVSLGGRNVMFDCGMHMGYNDERRFPDFSLLTPSGEPLLHLVIDCVIITHFHLDHCGALPYMTEQCGYTGPIFMTNPTKALCPILLEDYRRITVERRGEGNFFTSPMITACMAKVTPLRLEQSFTINDITLTPYYAGHVLGAAMFHVQVGKESVIYTGDYNMTPDRHLGAARPPFNLFLRPDVLITESTYATTFRESKRGREREFLRNIHQCVAVGGKVLIPVFAMGRVQELCILVEEYWQRMGLSSIPVYFSAGMAEAANEYYKVHVDWCSDKVKRDYPVRNAFDFAHIRPFEKHLADQPGPMVLFSSPGMLHSGMSLEIFKKWCGDEKNLLIIPGFCVSGTVGAKILSGQRQIEIEDASTSTSRTFTVRMQVKNMSFSAHADARGIMQMIKMTQPRNVVLVHGEAAKMAILKVQINNEMGIPCFDPPNGYLLHLDSAWDVPVRLDSRIIGDRLEGIERRAGETSDLEALEVLVKQRASNELTTCACIDWDLADINNGLPPSISLVKLEDSPLIQTFIDITKNIPAIYELLYKEFFPTETVKLLESKIITVKVGESITISQKDDEQDKICIEWRHIHTPLALSVIAFLSSQ